MGRTPSKPQNQAALKRLNALKKFWNLKTDRELAQRLEVVPPQIAKWRHRGLTAITAKLIDEILQGQCSE